MLNHFSQNLKNLRKLSYMSQKELAEQLNVTRQTISNYENKTRICELDMLIKIADVFKISVDELIR